MVNDIFRQTMAGFLVLAAALIGAFALDEIYYKRQDAAFSEAIEDRFFEQSVKTGAWILDRQHVADKIGIEIESLPSYQRAMK